RLREARAIRAGCAGGVDEVDGVDTVTAAAFGVVDDVIEDRQATEVGILAHLVRLVAELGDAEAADRSWLPRRLQLLGRELRGHDLCSSPSNNAVGLRVGAVPSVARGVDDIVTIGVVQYRGPAVVAAVGVGQRVVEAAPLVDGRDNAIVAPGHRVSRV